MIQRINDNANALKVVLTLMVVFIHSFSLVPADENTLLYSTKVYLSSVLPRVAVPMFFIYSGYFFFKGKECGLRTWYNKMKTRLHTLVLPFVLWSVIGGVFFLCIDKSKTSLGLLDVLIRTFVVDVYAPTSSLPQYVGYELPKVTALNGPLWYVRDLILLMLVSPLIYTILKRKVLSLAVMFVLLAAYLFTDTDKMPYVGIDCLLYFMFGGVLSYAKRDILRTSKSVQVVLTLLVIVTSVWALHAFGSQAETISRHWYIVAAILFILTVSIPEKIRSTLAIMQMGGVKCSLYIARISW